MKEYRKRPTTVEALRWNKVGDHPAVVGADGYWAEGADPCRVCGMSMTLHGWNEGDDQLCPGDWLVDDGDGAEVWGDQEFCDAHEGVIFFPYAEREALAKRLRAGLTIFTTRIKAELGRYREGDTLDSAFGPLRALSVERGFGIEAHPYGDELAPWQQGEIEGGGEFDLIQLLLAGCPECGAKVQTTPLTPPDEGTALGCSRCPWPGVYR